MRVVNGFGDHSHGSLRALIWSLGLALALLLLLAPGTAKAADPDGHSSLLGGLTGGLGGLVEPVTTAVEPVTQIVEPATDPLVEPIVQPAVEPVLEPVTDVIEPVVEPVTTAVAPVTTALVEPVTSTVAPLVEPVEDLVDPVLEPVLEPVQPLTGIVTSVTEPVTQIVEPIIEPVVEPIIETVATEPASGRETLAPTEPMLAPALPAVDVVLPAFTPITPILPGSSDGPAPTEPLTVPSAATGRLGVVDAGRPAFAFGSEGTTWTPPPNSVALVAGPATDRGSAAPWWTRLGPIGSFGGLGSGQTLSGVAFGVGVALGLLLLFLLPPPYRVSRLHVAAVFWRPQHFVGRLVPPG
jgi:hypothetical protein